MSSSSIPTATPTTISQTIYPVPSATSTSTTDNANVSLSAATYYGAVALAIFFLFLLSFLSRLLYIRRARRTWRSERADLERRGESSDLPTYHETTAPQDLTYWGLLRSSSVPHRGGIQVPEPAYDAANSGSRRGEQPVVEMEERVSPPAYVDPPKYDDASAARTSSTEVSNQDQGQVVEAEAEASTSRTSHEVPFTT